MAWVRPKNPPKPKAKADPVDSLVPLLSYISNRRIHPRPISPTKQVPSPAPISHDPIIRSFQQAQAQAHHAEEPIIVYEEEEEEPDYQSQRNSTPHRSVRDGRSYVQPSQPAVRHHQRKPAPLPPPPPPKVVRQQPRVPSYERSRPHSRQPCEVPLHASILEQATDPGDRGPGIIAGNIVVVVLATVAVGLRLVSRHMQRLSLEADYYLKFAALAFLASEFIWAGSIPIIKISILLLYIRILGRLRYFKIIAYIIGVFSICWGIMVILVCSLQCRPIQFLWDKGIKGTCINAPLFFFIGSAPNVFTDFVLLVLPLPASSEDILDRYIPSGISVSDPKSIEALAVQMVWQDLCYQSGSLGIVSVCSTAEPNLGIVSACMPTVKPLFRRFLPQGKTHNAKRSKPPGICSDKRYLSATASFGSSGRNKMKIGRAHQQFRELDDDTSEHLTGGARSGTQTYITRGEAGGEGAGIPLNAIEVQTNLDGQHTSRETLRKA
ncbi:MAG: hypothetical protein Q9184_003388 [Pyrenodesmia sp. 2 TL-2023]